MPSKVEERLFLEQMLSDLAWTSARVVDGDEPPDFYLEAGQRRIAVEVTKAYAHEDPAKGSPEAAQEGEYHRFASDIAKRYYANPSAQHLRVRVLLPFPIKSPAVRQWSHEERKQQLRALADAALQRLRSLRPMRAWERLEFEIEGRDGRPAKFYVQALPADTGIERRWDVINTSAGWRELVDPVLLQDKIEGKARALGRYPRPVDSSVLLLVANAMRASGFVDVAPDVVVDGCGFDSVYFQRYGFATRELALASRR